MSRIAVLTSGGVDSSVALCRLAEQGSHRLEAYYLKIWLEDEMAFLGSCPWEEDLGFVREICRRLDVPLTVIALQREYFESVVANALEELRAGRTPSPDVLCNRTIKFGAFVERVGDRADLVASGHYARVVHRAEAAHLLQGVDPVKDQTYFLCQLQQHQLARCVFPVGELSKSEVREQARRFRLPNRDRPDSQGICFLGRIPYDDFIAFYLGEERGEIRQLDSHRLLGHHRGYWFHTIGQRRGLGLASGPWYVADKDPRQNIVYVVHARQLADHHRRTFTVAHPNWIVRPPAPGRFEIRIRHGARLLPCSISIARDGSMAVDLDEGDPGVAAGQFAVVYDGEVCLGGGPISDEPVGL